MNSDKPFVAICVMAALAAPLSIARADDTEIFVGSEEVERRPNVMFVVDTSGSMDEDVVIETTPYEGDTQYDEDCVADNGEWVYWSSGNQPPNCGTNRRIRPSQTQNSCDDMHESVDSQSGRALGVRAEQYRPFFIFGSRWQTLQAGNYDDEVRCNQGGSQYSFFSANYMNWYHSEDGGTETKTRMEIVQELSEELVDSISGVNIGLMRFDQGSGSSGFGDTSWSGGYVDLEMGNIADQRAAFKEKINSYSPLGSTPMTETLFEAMRYWRGEELEYGDHSEPDTSTAAARDGNHYESPIEHECQKNHIVYLSDGEPQYDGEADDEIRGLASSSCGHYDPYDPNSTASCFDDLAEYLYEEDQDPSSGRINRVVTHTVGFEVDLPLLQAAANKGGGKYYTANDYDELKTALEDIFTEILAGTNLFTAPALSVDAFNRLEHLNELYFALFTPDDGAVWPGNVKRYDVGPDGSLIDAQEPPQDAVDETTGEFIDDSRSFWSDVADGGDVEQGGAAGQLTRVRNLYTNVDQSEDADLTTDPDYVLHENNELLTPEKLGLDSGRDDYRERLLRWIRGMDVDDSDGDGDSDDARRAMGDPLHTRPELVTYGEDENDPQLTLFMTTNEGYLHAIDTEDGTERWAFMPQEMLSKIQTQYENPVESDDRMYGLDGPLSVDMHDDGIRLFASMRRGGYHYYGLDISERDAPELMWTISGGQGEFAELGESWSRAAPAEIEMDGERRQVVIFAGGYDPAQDTATQRAPDSQGRAIFIADAADGELIWYGGGNDSAGDPNKVFDDMAYSIPSDIRVLDMNRDGLADRMYVGDMGGQVWRFDIDNGSDVDDLVTGGVVADLADDGEEADTRRFYNAPDVALMDERGEQWLSISIGSGWRAHPLDDQVEDRFYMIRDHAIYDPPTDKDGDLSYADLRENDLYDATANVIGEGPDEQREAAVDELFNDKDGWFIELENDGEKVMAESTTLDGQVIFTTYQPDEKGSTQTCAPGEGISRAYTMNVTDATPVADRNEDGTETASDRSQQLKRGGIPPKPTVMVVNGERRVFFGPEEGERDPNPSPPEIIYWRN
ncbi:MAG: hypothetical protein WD382_05730 [Halofilum sp. (in: g-proteobacteria)]